jgi:hypothetical protein
MLTKEELEVIPKGIPIGKKVAFNTKIEETFFVRLKCYASKNVNVLKLALHVFELVKIVGDNDFSHGLNLLRKSAKKKLKSKEH